MQKNKKLTRPLQSLGLGLSVKGAVLNSQPLVSADELHMLLAPSTKDKFHAQSSAYKYRNLFLLLCTLWFFIRLMFFPEAVYQVLTSPLSSETFLPYLQKRGWLYLFWMIIYGWSYTKNWYFERVALVCFVSEVTTLGMDYLTLSPHIFGPMSPLLTFFLLLRFVFIACLLMNAVEAHQVPRMTRSFGR